MVRSWERAKVRGGGTSQLGNPPEKTLGGGTIRGGKFWVGPQGLRAFLTRGCFFRLKKPDSKKHCGGPKG